ncbi:hypothetical protein VTJ04DRAFT_99 [Mycothermus thermophilus]|uniref:uncharacterized protein n=1 Tax=Humicola insolens TaxID=85995 RepID=UPI003743211C
MVIVMDAVTVWGSPSPSDSLPPLPRTTTTIPATPSLLAAVRSSRWCCRFPSSSSSWSPFALLLVLPPSSSPSSSSSSSSYAFPTNHTWKSLDDLSDPISPWIPPYRSYVPGSQPTGSLDPSPLLAVVVDTTSVLVLVLALFEQGSAVPVLPGDQPTLAPILQHIELVPRPDPPPFERLRYRR